MDAKMLEMHKDSGAFAKKQTTPLEVQYPPILFKHGWDPQKKVFAFKYLKESPVWDVFDIYNRYLGVVLLGYYVCFYWNNWRD